MKKKTKIAPLTIQIKCGTMSPNMINNQEEFPAEELDVGPCKLGKVLPGHNYIAGRFYGKKTRITISIHAQKWAREHPSTSIKNEKNCLEKS